MSNRDGDPVEAVLFDLGGVILDSPFPAFAAYERQRGLPPGFLRGLNARDPDGNAWARLERGEIDVERFCREFEAEAAAAGGSVHGRDVLALLPDRRRPVMAAAVAGCAELGLKTALLTNNVAPLDRGAPTVADLLPLFDAVVESSQVGVRKPEPRFYQLACELLEVSPRRAVFLDDLGINLKPARAMGMRTIKVGDAGEAVVELERALGVALPGVR